MTLSDGGERGGRGAGSRAKGVFAAVDRRLLAIAGLLLFVGAAWLAYQAFDVGGPRGEGFRATSGVGMAIPDMAPAPAEPPALREDADFAARGPSFDGDESGAGAGGPSQLNLAGRTIIRTGTLDLRVEEVDTGYHRVQQIASAAGGFVAESTFTGTDDQQRATLTIRVPADRFQSVIDELREMAVEVRSLSTSAQDVTEEYTDLQSNLRNLRAVEAQYIELLGRSQEIRDVLQVQEHLNSVRAQIERVQGRMQMLEQLSELATLTVSLRPADGPAVVTGGIGEAVREAWAASLRSIEAVATVALVAIVYSWWLLPVFVLLAVALRRWLRAPRPVERGGEAAGGGA